MSRTAAAGPARARPHGAVPPSTGRQAVRAAAGLALRSTRRGGTVVLLLVAGLSALVAWQYRATFATSTDVASLQVLATNPAIRTLFGAPVALDDPGGFTVWRTGTFAALLTGLWTLLAAVRLTRGEEDAGRWALLLAGRLRMRDVVAVQVAVVAARGVLTGAGLLVALVLAGADVTGSLRYGACVAAIGVLGAGTGAALAQVLPSRSAAAGAGGAAAAASLLLRMLADGVEALSWLAWFTPFGLLALVQPYAADRTAPLGVLSVAAVTACAAAVVAAAHRDLGAGLLAVRDGRAARTRLLGSLPAFALRRALRGLAGWGAGLAAYFLLVGALTVSLTDFLEANPVFAEMAAAAGFAELATVEGFAASMFALLPVPLGAYVAGRLAATAAAETERRLTPVLALPVPRLRWLRAEAAVAALAATLLAVVCGVAFWAGAVLVAAPLSLPDAVAGALNPMPVTLLCLAAAVLALGVRPSAVLPVGVLPAVGGYVLQVLAESLSWPREVLQLAPSSHVAAVPATTPDWAGAAGTLAVAAVLAGVGAVAYRRRDLRA